MGEQIALAKRVVELAAQQGFTLATAESVTAGLIAASIADVPGASKVLLGGIISYALAVKRDVLGVTGIGEDQVVSKDCATQMAAGARKLTQADIAVSATGIAGPGGGTDDVPVGTVWIGCASAAGIMAKKYHFTGNRQAVREQTVQQALTMISNCMKGGHQHGGKENDESSVEIIRQQRSFGESGETKSAGERTFPAK